MDASLPEEKSRASGDWRSRLKAVVAIDPRSLATCRIAMGSLLLFDLLWRAPDMEALYTDAGIMPVDRIRVFFEGTWRWSIHWLNGSPEFQIALFVLAGLFALAMLVGFQTRLATIGCWVLWASLHARAPLVINGGDTFFRTLLFWAMFLPWGKVWSVDAWRNKRGGAGALRPIVTVGTAAILLQVCIMYWATAVYKIAHETWQTGEGLHNALAWGAYNKPLGIFLLDYPEITKFLTHATIWLEFIGPVLALLPFCRPYLRMAMVTAFVGFHVGVDLCMYVGLFSYVSIAAWTLFLPSEFWDARVWQRLGFRAPSSDAVAPAPAELKGLRSAGPRWAGGLAVGALCAGLLAFTVAYNIVGLLQRERGWAMPRTMQSIAEVTAMQQRWAMFARPMWTTNWFVATARLKDGSQVDLLRDGQPIELSRPERIALLYGSHRWRKYFLSLTRSDPRFEPFRQTLCDYLFREWNDSHGPEQQIVTLDLQGVYEKIGGNDPLEEHLHVVCARTESEDVQIEDTIDFWLPFESR